MRSSAVLSALSVIAVASAQSNSAPVTTGNPVGVTYVATLPESGQLQGSLSGTSNGTGVSFTFSIRGLPTSGGPFGYHIHDQPVPSNGSCLAALAHLDPFQRGEDPPCNATAPQTCQVGDLSGKYGKISSDPFETSYVDLYTSTTPGNPGFFGNRSFVVHYANKTRIACANFVLKSTNGTSTASAVPAPTSPSGTPHKPTTTPPTSAAAAASFAPASAFFSGLLVFLLLL
ncbi:hypothetical protein GP486_003750 [Trichoglossum hirsutum]|uniref:superoxide dismutase n=1 Tax=Trichoglossum hirsutum TaxID=265104 RepID=A0A9P8LCI3_9PEZI|nr:hypothetical protein GP486_003750 [Trichoglossum hirsutum]